MYLLRLFILDPILETNGMALRLQESFFFLIVLSVILLSAAGYIVNDYYDRQTDSVNKPERVIVGKYIGMNTAFNIHLALNFLAIITSYYISSKIGVQSVFIAFIVVAGLLYFYSTTYKSQLIIGNIMVALFAAFVPIIVLLSELPLIKSHYLLFLPPSNDALDSIFYWLIGYALFAFLISLLREIIKDMEDLEGDSAYGKNTIPVKFGISITKTIVLTLVAISIGATAYITFTYLLHPFALLYILPLVISPLLYIGIIIYRSSDKKQYTLASNLCKFVMLSGILFSILFKFLFI